MNRCQPKCGLQGFTLTELAVVLVIVALLIGGMLLPLAAQDDLRRTTETQKTLNEIRDALLGFAAANSRLPCPAAPGAIGVEALIAGACTNPYDGLAPGITLGLAPINGQGYVIDGWGNPIRYAITTSNLSAFVKPMTGAGFTAFAPDLTVCPTAQAGANAVQNPGTTTASCPATVAALTTNAVAVIYSLGANAGRGGTGTDERHNPNIVPASDPSYVTPDRLFISHEPTPASAPNGEFDDLVIWLSPNILYNRMIAAGRLP